MPGASWPRTATTIGGLTRSSERVRLGGEAVVNWQTNESHVEHAVAAVRDAMAAG